jgi:LPXTG-motif cell wall-anchored protein
MYPGTAPFVHEDTATVCPPVEVPANPKADITKVCGAADITLTNPQKDGEANKTASFVVNVDGTFYGAYAVEPNKSETVKLTFPEDSGDHKVEVFQSGTSEWKRIAKATVESDCIPPQPEDKIVFSEWVDGEYECTATEVPQTRTKSVTPYVLVDGKWVAGETVTTTENQTRPLTEAEQEAADIECAGPQPENKITETPWVDSEYQCGDSTVQITRQVTSTEYVREGSKWVEGESVTTTQTETRALTAEEIEAKNIECAGEQPPAKVVPGEWSKPVITCDNEEGDVLDITREVTTTPYIRVGAEWVLDTENAKTVTEEGTYTVTAEDIAALECETEEPPVVTPPVDEPKTPVKAAKPPVEIAEGEGFLATTGGDATPLWIGGIAILLAGAGIYLATRRRKVDAE